MKNRLIVNPTTDDFRDAVAAEVFVDKSELIHYTNSVMNTPQKLTCFSRPRRFGKTFAAQMLKSYYTRGLDSSDVFSNLRWRIRRKLMRYVGSESGRCSKSIKISVT